MRLANRSLPHPSGLVNAAALVAILLAVMALALRANVSPPPIAAFAPVVQQHLQAPSEQGSAFGNGGQGQGGGGMPPSPAPAPSPPPDVKLRRCVGDPPRQIEDPQSPPCVAYWQGNNGGSTSRGLTGDSINLAIPYQGPCPAPGNSNTFLDEASALARFFSDRFELYGRTVHTNCEDGGTTTAAWEQNSADLAAAFPDFASTEWIDTGGLQYHEELARKGVVSGFGFETNPTEAFLKQYDPYLWSYDMTSDNMLAETGNWYCAELASHKAAHATDPTIANSVRKLGVYYFPWDTNLDTPMSPLLQALSRCGVTPDFIDDSSSNNSQNAILKFKEDGVTSVLCVCEYARWATALVPDASGEAYYPEWIMTSYGGGDTQFTFHLWNPPANETKSTFGLTFEPRQELLANNPMWWAWSEGSNGSTKPTTFTDIYQGELLYRSFLEILSGIQMAGPDLTPRTFKRGLQNTAFPNPSTPLYAGNVDFFGGSHAMTVDAAEWWFDPGAPSPWAAQGDPPGAICYVAHGLRHGITDWRAGQPDNLFKQPCDSGG